MTLSFKKPKKKKGMIREYFEAIVIALFFAFIIRTFFIAAYKIPSGSMLDTLLIGDHLLVNKFTYGIKNPLSGGYLTEGNEPQIGDIIVFAYPQNNDIDYIKRIVGLPGDIIEIRDKQLIRNGEAVQEEYVRFSEPNSIIPVRDNMHALTVPEGKYFVMGDNRDNSEDSRYWGFVDKELIHGKAWRFYWSWDSEETRPRISRIGRAVE